MKPTPVTCARWLAAVTIDATRLWAGDVGVTVRRKDREVLVPWSNVRQVDL